MQILSVVVLVFISTPLISADFVVSNNSDAGPGSLRQAILDANASVGGTITFSGVTGTITLQSSLPALVKQTIILGPGALHLTLLSATASLLTNAPANTAYVSGLKLTATNGVLHNLGTLTLNNCIVADGYSTLVDGVGIYSSDNLFLHNCIISGHRSAGGNGAGIFNSGSMYLNQCAITNNGGGPTTAGGGIYNWGHASLDDCTVSGNYSRYMNGAGIHNAGAMELNKCFLIENRVTFAGGAAVFNSGTLTVNACTLAGNYYTGGGNGAGLYNDSPGTALLLNSSITNNTSMSGGGIWNAGWLQVFSSTIAQNVATYSGGPIPGGGIYNDNSATVLLENTTISGNNSYDLGGGIMNYGMLVAVNSTIVSNLAYPTDSLLQAGGGICNSGTVHLKNTILAGNTAPDGPDFYGTLLSDGFNLIQDITDCSITGATTGNITGLDPLLGPLQNNGGPTPTHALLWGSPAIDSGTSYGAPTTDQRAVPRPQGTAVDIGAFECQHPVPTFLAVSLQFRTNLWMRSWSPPFETYTLESSTNLVRWDAVTTFDTGSNGLWEFIDIELQNHPARFYRLKTVVP